MGREIEMNVHAIRLPNGYGISDDRGRIDMEVVHRSLARAYWSIGRSRELTERSWASCLCLGVYAPDGAMVGFARILTDYALRAHLCDVFVETSLRGLGLGSALVAAALGHPELATVGRWTLTTSDAHLLYAKYGFKSAETDPMWMTLGRSSSTHAPI